MLFSDFKHILIKTGRRLGRPDILFWTLPYLMALIFVGTIAQKSMGLYDAQRVFFSSFFFLGFGVVPLPGGYSVLLVMTVNLVCKFLFLSPWTRAKVGIHIIHLSVIILLVGGLLTALTMKEGYIALQDGESGAVIQDYHKRTLSFGTDFIVNFYDVKYADYSALPFDVEILQTCENSGIAPREDLDDPDNDGIGAASMAALVCVQPSPENERNIAGLLFRVSNAAEDTQNGVYLAFEGRQTQDEIMGLPVRLDREERALPFTVTLNRFRREVYPGSNMPRDYQSRVTITDGAVTWPAVIAMNEPLRYGGYTFYQASTYLDKDGRPVSVLSVVTNKGWIFPYLSGILLTVGLIWHLILRVRQS